MAAATTAAATVAMTAAVTMTMAMITTVATAVMTAVSAAIRFLCRGSNPLTTALPADGATGAAAASASTASLHCRRHQRHADLPASAHVWLCCDCAAAAGVKQSCCPFFSLSMSLPELSSAVFAARFRGSTVAIDRAPTNVLAAPSLHGEENDPDSTAGKDKLEDSAVSAADAICRGERDEGGAVARGGGGVGSFDTVSPTALHEESGGPADKEAMALPKQGTVLPKGEYGVTIVSSQGGRHHCDKRGEVPKWMPHQASISLAPACFSDHRFLLRKGVPEQWLSFVVGTESIVDPIDKREGVGRGYDVDFPAVFKAKMAILDRPDDPRVTGPSDNALAEESCGVPEAVNDLSVGLGSVDDGGISHEDLTEEETLAKGADALAEPETPTRDSTANQDGRGHDEIDHAIEGGAINWDIGGSDADGAIVAAVALSDVQSIHHLLDKIDTESSQGHRNRLSGGGDHERGLSQEDMGGGVKRRTRNGKPSSHGQSAEWAWWNRERLQEDGETNQMQAGLNHIGHAVKMMTLKKRAANSARRRKAAKEAVLCARDTVLRQNQKMHEPNVAGPGLQEVEGCDVNLEGSTRGAKINKDADGDQGVGKTRLAEHRKSDANTSGIVLRADVVQAKTRLHGKPASSFFARAHTTSAAAILKTTPEDVPDGTSVDGSYPKKEKASTGTELSVAAFKGHTPTQHLAGKENQASPLWGSASTASNPDTFGAVSFTDVSTNSRSEGVTGIRTINKPRGRST
eukprot:jgi/Undpi1/1207/HiC_scaffold_106.g14121.m1